MTTAEAYVTAAFLVVLAAVLLWLVIYAFKMRRLESEVRELEAASPPIGADLIGAPRVVPAQTAEPPSADAPGGESPAGRTAEPAR